MTATIFTFPSRIAAKASRRHAGTFLTPAWAEQHLPLINTAMDLLRCDNRQLRRRCRAIVEAEGHPMIEQLVAQLDRLCAHLAMLVTNLSMVAKRVRATMATEGLGL